MADLTAFQRDAFQNEPEHGTKGFQVEDVAGGGGGRVFLNVYHGSRDYFEGVLYWLRYGRKQGVPFTDRERALLQQARLISDYLDAQIDDDWMLLL